MTTLKLLAFLMTYVLVVYGNEVEQKDNVESYITKEAAKELRNKLSARGGEQQDHDYDEILKKIIMSVQPDDNSEQIVYEKKYFDYLPNDLDSEDVTDEDSTHELVALLDEDVYSKTHEAVRDNGRRVNSRKFKRDLASQERAKRQSIYFVPVPLVHYNPYPNVNFYAPPNFPELPSTNIQSRFDRNQANPWQPQNNPAKLHAPYNFYLPAALPGINYNVPSPPHNPNEVDTVDRINLFEDDDTAQRIWPNFNNKNQGGGGGSSGFSSGSSQRPRTTTQRPRTTTVKQQFGDTNSIDFGMPGQGGMDEEVEIEYPPDTFDLPLTTRAPLKRPTISKNKNPNREKPRNRQKENREETTSTTPSPDRTSSSRQQNQSVPACVLAITNCCSRYDELVRVPCFEKYNCEGTFFGLNPCSRDIKAAAFREVEKFSQ